MSKPLLSRQHLEAFSIQLLDEVFASHRDDISDEGKSRVVIYMTIAFHLHAQNVPVTIAAVAERARFNTRTVSSGFKTLADWDYLTPALTVARHGRGRAFEFSFSPRFTRRVIETHAKMTNTMTAPTLKRA
jgi:hypothetical protein